jgi:hypothetical protein
VSATGELALCLAGAALEAAGARLFPGAEVVGLAREELRPRVPFRGALFGVLAGVERGSCVGLVVPVGRVSPAALPKARPRATRTPVRPPGAAAGSAPPQALLPVSDHVNLELRGPLTGRWPAGVPRDFPQVAGIYQPALVRASGGPRVYSTGVVVAGVADARRLTPFEAQAVAGLGVIAVSDVLVPAAIVAAYYGLTLAACGVPPADDNDEQ